jgi:two-component system, NtrC family, sensor kinase
MGNYFRMNFRFDLGLDERLWMIAAPSMRVSFRKKVILALTVYLVFGGAIWFLNYYNNSQITRRLRALEKKEDLLNTILEARRFEKNFFLTLHAHHLDNAVTYIRQAEEKMAGLPPTDGQGPYSEGAALQPTDLADYRKAMVQLTALNSPEAASPRQRLSPDEIEANQEIIRRLGRIITEASEATVMVDREHINRLIVKARFYHLATLAGMILITMLAMLFFFFNVIRPLKMLEEAIVEIASGNFDNVPSIAPAVEFESLVGSLNKMIRMLNRRSEDLIQAKKLAALGTLTSGVAHELNNPLNNISTSMQIMLEEIEAPDVGYQRELLIDAEKEVERARDIVRALLEFSRQRAFSIKNVLFRPLVEDTIKLIKGELPATVNLIVDIPDDIQAAVDFRRIQQVLLNLIFNAIQAMENGGSLTISAQRCGPGEFYFRIADTGAGIPPDLLPKIFDPFFSTKRAHRRSESDSKIYDEFLNHKGTGLGLAICHGIVKKHGGRIDVESHLDEGTSFTVYLPMEKADDFVH